LIWKGLSVRRIFSIAAALACLAGGAWAPRPPQPNTNAIDIPFEKFTLPNGLTAILSVDRATPTVAVNAWYHVGSKNETPGRTGFAHLFEHVMFTGSGHVPYGLHDKLTIGIGGSNNGTTDNDRTDYYETVPSNYLESTIWLEADRMGFLLDALDLAKLNAQRDVVKNERRQSVDNQPYGRASEILSGATYPASHPYSWDVIGSMQDLSAASEEDVKSFFRLYYSPNNCILAVVGDFDPAQAKAWIARYFGGVPRGKSFARPAISPVTLAAEKRLIFEDRVQVPRLYLQWPTVGQKSEDRFALQTLAFVLGGGRTARLTKPLVYDQQSATNVSARQSNNEDVGEFGIVVTPARGKSLTDIETSIDSLLERMKADGPTAEEIAGATASQDFDFLNGLQSNLGKSNRLADGEGFHGDAGYFKAEYARRRAVTPADVKRVANTYLTTGRVVLSVVPIGKTDQASKPGQGQKVSGGGA
jgi:zinc protease